MHIFSSVCGGGRKKKTKQIGAAALALYVSNAGEQTGLHLVVRPPSESHPTEVKEEGEELKE